MTGIDDSMAVAGETVDISRPRTLADVEDQIRREALATMDSLARMLRAQVEARKVMEENLTGDQAFEILCNLGCRAVKGWTLSYVKRRGGHIGCVYSLTRHGTRWEVELPVWPGCLFPFDGDKFLVRFFERRLQDAERHLPGKSGKKTK